MSEHHQRLSVGQSQAVEILATKILRKGREGIAWRRLLRGARTAQRRYHQVRGQRNVGFYHGLLTGYAVALKTLEGKVGGMVR